MKEPSASTCVPETTRSTDSIEVQLDDSREVHPHTAAGVGRSRPRSHGDREHVTVQIWSGGGRSPALGNLGSPLLTHLRVGLDEVNQATVLGTIGSGEAQGAWLTGTDRALGLWATGHHVLLRFHGNSRH